ncbi:uncharacterized protein CTRU02_214407 [Colletotrichum truncatum]|uniref:Uncharacterized protein n=1 Tax=Colletotrichum truncatum TaxID=5467 RepID=A0ACC3YG29_COLTU|nr:uncharacterized protein CTRU02_13488 [Colletotrichum truncatum]KAF6783252.1 hypothetical protein CTRU02_13488 [Colletotrichum truncatum]
MVGGQSDYGVPARSATGVSKGGSDGRLAGLHPEDGRGPEPRYGAAVARSYDPPDHFIPLQSIFPRDLLDLLALLPSTLRSVELSFLWFMKNSGHYRDLLVDMRNTLGWREREVNLRPRVMIRDDSGARMAGRGVCIDNEVCELLYGNGENPYPIDPNPEVYFRSVGYGFGTEEDAFEPRFKRPYVISTELNAARDPQGVWG